MPEARESQGGLGGFIRRSGYLRKWLILGIAIGIIAGLGAVVFYLMLDYAGRFLLGFLGGYDVPTAYGDGGDKGSPGFDRPWAIPLITLGGALVSAYIVAKLAPEAEGHGTDSAIEAVHTDPRAIRARAVLVKMVTSALTIGSGGSGGREGPTAQISAGFGSLLTRWLDLSDEDGRVAVSIGIGSGIGAIFGAPLGGAVLAASIVYREDFDYRSLIPGFITSGTAYAIYGSILGFEPLFGFIAPDYHFDARQLVWFLVIGIVSAAIGYLYARVFYGTVTLTKRLPGGSVLKPAVGGLHGGPAGTADSADPVERIRLGAVGVGEGHLDDDPAVDRADPAARQDRRDVAVDRHRRVGRHLRPRHRDRCVCRRGDLAARRPRWRTRDSRRPRRVRRRRDDGLLRQRRARATGRDAHGGRDDRLVLSDSWRDDRGRHRLPAHHTLFGVDLSGAAAQP